AARFARARRHHLYAVGVEKRGFGGGVFVRRAEIHRPAIRAGLEVLHHLLHVLRTPLARHSPDYQPRLGGQRERIPIVALLGRGGVVRPQGLFLSPPQAPFFRRPPPPACGGNPPLIPPSGPGGGAPASTA